MSRDTGNTANVASRPSVLASRRRFLQFAVASLGAAWAGFLVRSQLFPRSQAQEARAVEIPLADLPPGSTRAIVYGGTPVLVVRTPESIRAFSLICTHLGCQVQWQAGKEAFYCPCHEGRYDRFGEVIAGPPPVPLEQLPVRTESGTIIVGELA